MVAGNLLFRDLKTVGALGSAGVGSAKLSALGKSAHEIRAFLQPIVIDPHLINNPWSNYNVYLSTIMIPGVLMLFIFLITVYSIGTELKFDRAKEWIQQAGGNIWVAMIGKLLPQFVIFITLFLGYLLYQFYVLGFPHPGGIFRILLLGVLSVLAAEGFGSFVFGLMPSLRMSMSVCSLWAVLSFSTSGATYPVFAMNPMLEALSWLFPLRHYYMFYQISIFNGFPLSDVWIHVTFFVGFALLPLLTIRNIKKAMLEYVYIP
jgi:ABC-2 type transport system permease protein